MKLSNSQVKNEEVKSWQGLHLLHYAMSSCSQKVRILLAEKGLDYTSHPINLAKEEHITPWFLGINPRGVVPVLIHNGEVHIESNDILAYLDSLPSNRPSLFPKSESGIAFVAQSLNREDAIHMDLRNLTMGFLFPRFVTKKSKKTLDRYLNEGEENSSRLKEVKWWQDYADHGLPEDVLTESLKVYSAEFSILENRLIQSDWLFGQDLGVLDISWYISVNRLVMAGYPIALFPNLDRWYRRLNRRDSFYREVSPGFLLDKVVVPANRVTQKLRGKSLMDIVERNRMLLNSY